MTSIKTAAALPTKVKFACLEIQPMIVSENVRLECAAAVKGVGRVR
jgi:hypothetical protein